MIHETVPNSYIQKLSQEFGLFLFFSKECNNIVCFRVGTSVFWVWCDIPLWLWYPKIDAYHCITYYWEKREKKAPQKSIGTFKLASCRNESELFIIHTGFRSGTRGSWMYLPCLAPTSIVVRSLESLGFGANHLWQGSPSSHSAAVYEDKRHARGSSWVGRPKQLKKWLHHQHRPAVLVSLPPWNPKINEPWWEMNNWLWTKRFKLLIQQKVQT